MGHLHGGDTVGVEGFRCESVRVEMSVNPLLQLHLQNYDTLPSTHIRSVTDSEEPHSHELRGNPAFLFKVTKSHQKGFPSRFKDLSLWMKWL